MIEKVLSKQITIYLQTNNLVPQNHQGGLKGRSGTITIAGIVQKISKNINKNETIALATSDQSSAYDLLNHSIIEKKTQSHRNKIQINKTNNGLPDKS